MDAAGMARNGRNNGSGSCGYYLWAAWSFCRQQPGPMAARYLYTAIFLVGNVSAWFLRESPIEIFKGQRHSGCNGDRDCLASEAVLMISFANFLFYLFMFISTVYTRTVHQYRSKWHSGWWPAKIILLLGCYMSPVLVPDYFLQLYGKVAPYGAGAFLVIQLISVIRYITRLNSRWCGQNFENHRRRVNMISKLAYGCSMVGILYMVFWYDMGCKVNIVFVSTTLALVYIMPIISSLLSNWAEGFYMEPLLMGVYIAFICWSAIKSEPETSSCNKNQNTSSGVKWITIASFIAELASVAVAAFSTGTEYKCMQFTNVVESGNDIPYGYGFFHFDFAMGSMYFGMNFLGWETHHVSKKWSMDVGWTSAIVHMVNEGLAVGFYMVVLFARYYEIDWLQQLLGKIFGTGGQQLAEESNYAAIELIARSGTDNNGRLLESDDDATEELKGAETGNSSRAPQDQSSPTATDVRTETGSNEPPQASRDTEPVGTERDDDGAQPSSSSSSSTSTTTGSVRLGRMYGEIEEEW